jgi:branched-chain amino acid transport system ATP-binding protein
MPDLLELDAITGGYRQTTVLRDVSFTVPAGSIVALLGANGAGKTTLLRTAAGLLRPTSGQLVLRGNDITRLSPARRAQCGLCLIPEGRGVFRNLTVAENLKLFVLRGAGLTPPAGAQGAVTGSTRRGVKPRPSEGGIDGVIEIFPVLGKRMRQLAGTMSGGEQQMLALARAMLANPSVVMLDEVSMGLAPKIIDEIFASLKTIAAKGISLLVVEQYVQLALELADRAVLIQRGSITFDGPARELGRDRLRDSYLSAGAG